MVLKDILRKYRKPFEFHGDKDVLHEVNILNVKICVKIPSALLFFFFLFIYLETSDKLCAMCFWGVGDSGSSQPLVFCYSK